MASSIVNETPGFLAFIVRRKLFQLVTASLPMFLRRFLLVILCSAERPSQFKVRDDLKHGVHPQPTRQDKGECKHWIYQRHASYRASLDFQWVFDGFWGDRRDLQTFVACHGQVALRACFQNTLHSPRKLRIESTALGRSLGIHLAATGVTICGGGASQSWYWSPQFSVYRRKIANLTANASSFKLRSIKMWIRFPAGCIQAAHRSLQLGAWSPWKGCRVGLRFKVCHPGVETYFWDPSRPKECAQRFPEANDDKPQVLEELP